MSDTRLGQLPPANSTRDAIHVAIVPVMAGMRLRPGDHVGLICNVAMTSAEPLLGIVDPFLLNTVQKGEVFYLCLYQQTVTGMRHHWSHPAFPIVDDVPFKSANSEASKLWIATYAARLGISYDHLMQGAEEDDLCFGDSGHDFNDFEDEFWDHYYAVTGKRKSGNFFRCAC